jgi:hypothetical protein
LPASFLLRLSLLRFSLLWSLSLVSFSGSSLGLLFSWIKSSPLFLFPSVLWGRHSGSVFSWSFSRFYPAVFASWFVEQVRGVTREGNGPAGFADCRKNTPWNHRKRPQGAVIHGSRTPCQTQHIRQGRQHTTRCSNIKTAPPNCSSSNPLCSVKVWFAVRVSTSSTLKQRTCSVSIAVANAFPRHRLGSKRLSNDAEQGRNPGGIGDHRGRVDRRGQLRPTTPNGLLSPPCGSRRTRLTRARRVASTDGCSPGETQPHAPTNADRRDCAAGAVSQSTGLRNDNHSFPGQRQLASKTCATSRDVLFSAVFSEFVNRFPASKYRQDRCASSQPPLRA